MNARPFVTKTYESPSHYSPRTDAPALIDEADRDVVRHNLFDNPAPAHTKNYMVGLDVLGWTNTSQVKRSQLIVNQKAGALIVPWEPADGGGIWIYLQEMYRGPHSKDDRTVKDLLEQKAFDALGVWSLEAPAGGLQYTDGVVSESPDSAAIREAKEETGLIFKKEDLIDLIPGGLQISGDISTKRSYLFAANVAEGSYEKSAQAIEEDESVGELLAFRIQSFADLSALTQLTRIDASTTSALALAALQPAINQYLVVRN